MYKAKLATAAIHKAIELANELTCPVTIRCERSRPEVQVMGIGNLERVPGETEIRPIGPQPGPSGPYEASREYDGVKFYCLLTKGQYDRLQQPRGGE